MKRMIPLRFVLPLGLLAVAACSQDSAQPADPAPSSTPTSLGSGGDPVGGPDPAPTPEQDKETFAKNMPQAMLGRWHEDNLGRTPTATDCDPFRDGTRDYDRLITVREDGYGYFETGGRITQVHNRTDSMIDATFDTTYADTPTSERRDFALESGGVLAVDGDNGNGRQIVKYRRCPASTEGAP